MDKEKILSTMKKEWHLPYSQKLGEIVGRFSITEKTIFFIFSIIFIASGLTLLYKVNKLFLVEVPDYGGVLVEGIVGSPRFVNPLLSVSDADKDLSSLIYSGLLRANSDGELIPDLAESYTVSEDGLTYHVILKDNIYFHDGIIVTSDDILFTVEKAQDVSLKSPRSNNWEGVRVEKINDREIIFSLSQPYSPFVQSLTLGILPKHIWKNVSIEEFPFSKFNINPIGTGPYKIDNISYNGSGLPKEYSLKSFNKYSLGRPYITNLVIKLYQSEKDSVEAYKNGDIESLHSVSPKQIPTLSLENEYIILSPLPRVFGVFFNQNAAPVLVNKEVRSALLLATDKQAIVDSILDGYGEVIDGPIPVRTVATSTPAVQNASTTENSLDKAKALLVKNGWKENGDGILQKTDAKKNKTNLSFSISTGDAPELKETAYLLQQQWQKLGAQVEVKIFEIGDLNQNIIKTRKYDSLLFGEIIGRESDLYPFWHSSGRVSPGLNIALYTNIKVDRILENIRKTNDKDKQTEYFEDFTEEIKNDIPAVFTYSPYFIYIVPKKIHDVELGILTSPSERFSDIYLWYIETNNVWKIFTNKI